MALMSLDPTGAGRRRWTMRWKAPLNAFQIAFEGRLTPGQRLTPQQPRSADKSTEPSIFRLRPWVGDVRLGFQPSTSPTSYGMF
jgi:hypothetical protein